MEEDGRTGARVSLILRSTISMYESFARNAGPTLTSVWLGWGRHGQLGSPTKASGKGHTNSCRRPSSSFATGRKLRASSLRKDVRAGGEIECEPLKAASRSARSVSR